LSTGKEISIASASVNTGFNDSSCVILTCEERDTSQRGLIVNRTGSTVARSSVSIGIDSRRASPANIGNICMASAADASRSSPFLVDTASTDADVSEFDKTKNTLTSVAVN
jgi:hypothetical protein